MQTRVSRKIVSLALLCSLGLSQSALALPNSLRTQCGEALIYLGGVLAAITGAMGTTLSVSNSMDDGLKILSPVHWFIDVPKPKPDYTPIYLAAGGALVSFSAGAFLLYGKTKPRSPHQSPGPSTFKFKDLPPGISLSIGRKGLDVQEGTSVFVLTDLDPNKAHEITFIVRDDIDGITEVPFSVKFMAGDRLELSYADIQKALAQRRH